MSGGVAARPSHWLRALLCVIALGWLPPVFANSGSYATTGTGTYAQSLWWLDLSGYNDTTAVFGGQAFTFTLPNNAGTLTFTANKATGLSAFSAVAEPASTTGAFGHGAYSSIAGSPILYTTTTLLASTVTFNSMVMKDASGNSRSYVIYAADGENTTTGEIISLATSASWTLTDTVNYYASYNGASPTVSTVGTTVNENGSGTKNFNASLIYGSATPTTITASVLGTEGVLFALSLPTVTLNVTTVGRSDPSDQFTASIGYTSPVAAIKTATTVGNTLTATTGSTSVIGTNSLTLAAAIASGSASPSPYYSGSMSCTNSGPGATGYGGTATVLPSGSGTSFTLTPKTGDAITCTLTLTPVAQTLAGTVYADVNHNATLDGSEAGAGLAGLYVKIAALSGGVCQTTATAAAAVNSSTGTYSIASVAAGTYCLSLSNNSSLSSTTASIPSGWISTEGATGVRQITSAAIPSGAQNFGLYNGSSLTLSVFGDTGAGSGTANDGVQNGTEAGLTAVTVNAKAGGSTVATATTNGSGTAALWLPSTVSGTVSVSPVATNGNVPTGGSVGTTGGTFTRPNLTFTYAAGNAYTGVGFGLIAPNTLASNGKQAAQPGGIVFYPHSFVAGSAGSLTLSLAGVSSPTVSGWSETVYLDTTCSGQFASADTVIKASIAVTAAQQVCVLIKEFVPNGAPFNAARTLTLTATLVYSGSAAPATAAITNTDLTTASAVSAQFTKLVQNVTQSGGYTTNNTAAPGNTLQYQLTIVNQGNTSLSTVVINDSTPAYTTFVSAACPGTLPSTLTSCSLSTQPAAGSTGPVQWTFSGALAPGTQTTVTFQVAVTQ